MLKEEKETPRKTQGTLKGNERNMQGNAINGDFAVTQLIFVKTLHT